MSDEHRASGLSSSDWADETSQRWPLHADRREAILAPVDQVLLAAAGLGRGAVVLTAVHGR